jgi:hypothetical protein
MKTKTRATAQRLLNLYRQAHVIVGGWATVNPVFVNDINDNVALELQDLPTGKMLLRHIENLKNGTTPMDSIDRELLPYGGMMMGESVASIKLNETQMDDLTDAIENFIPTQQGLDTFTSKPIVQHFGEEWPTAIGAIVQTKPNLTEQWNSIKQTYNAYRLWDSANMVIANPLTERVRAQVQSEMPEYETYLPMFGDNGAKLLNKLRNFISTTN